MKLTIALAVTAALTTASAASAQEMMTWTAESKVTDVKVVGGIGPKADTFRSASWNQTTSASSSTGTTTTITTSCVGMDQPVGSLYDRHLTCNSSTSDGATGSSIMGCMKENESGSEMSCSGYFQGKTGNVKDHAALVTEYYRFTEGSTTGGSRSTGHWIR